LRYLWTIGDQGKQMESKLIVVRAAYDAEAHVWTVQSSDLPGLSGEASTLDALVERLPGMITDLIEENGFGDDGKDVTELAVEIIASQQTRVLLPRAA
jgi:hypothetical protein